MQIITKGKNIRLTDSMRALAHEKLARLPRYVQEITLAEVEFSVETACGHTIARTRPCARAHARRAFRRSRRRADGRGLQFRHSAIS